MSSDKNKLDRLVKMASFGVVRNIPAEFRSVDLKNFFSDFVENEKFKCFHFKHRPEALKPKDKEKTSEKPTKTGTCCCVFQTIDEASLSDFIEKYNNANWVNGKGDYLKARCIIHKIKTSGSIPGYPTSIGHVDSADRYFTRAEQKYNKRHAISETFSESNLLMLSELRPPVAVMPRGNVGTTTQEFMKLIRECKLPPSIIKKLDLKFPLTGSTRRYGNVHMEYTDTYEEAVKGQNTYTANGDLIDKKLPANAEVTNDAERNSPAEEAAASSLGEMSDADDDDDTCEEWERHEALHNDITSHERTKERLFEEEIELKWEKGGSGLVFYTDAQYWREQEGDFDEQTTDDWDVDMSEYYGERGDLDARQYLQMRKEKRRGKAVYDDSLAEELKLRKRQNNTRSRSESPPAVSKKRGDFEKHTKGVGRKLMERDGWKEGEPLGPQERPGAITDPVELDGRDPKKKGGLGYHGEKLLRSSTSGNTRWRPGVRLTSGLKFRGTRSREPLASQSGLFPEYANNLPNNEFKPRSRISRNRAVPGPDDGVVITTVYDDPLRIDEQDDFLRSRPPTAIKRRPKEKHADKGPENVPIKADVSVPSTSPIPLHLTGMKFVKGGVLKDSTTT